jgi:hypothetical protein
MENVTLSQIFDFAERLDKITDLKAQKIAESFKTDPYESEDTKEITTALSKAQGKFQKISFNRTSSYLGLGYTDLNNILTAVLPALEANQLAFTQQQTISPDGAVTLVTKLRHSSGQWIETRARVIPQKNDVKTFESILNTHKRLSAMSLLGITIANDPADDDGELAMASANTILAKGASLKDAYKAKDQSFEAITKEQVEELQYELDGYPELAEEIMNRINIQSLADMPKNLFLPTTRRIREIKLGLGELKKKGS